jgi:hypothetical protein
MRSSCSVLLIIISFWDRKDKEKVFLICDQQKLKGKFSTINFVTFDEVMNYKVRRLFFMRPARGGHRAIRYKSGHCTNTRTSGFLLLSLAK